MIILNNSQTSYVNRKLVFLGNDVPDEVLQGATVAILTENSWHIYGVKAMHSFDTERLPLPVGLHCPVLDVSKMSQKYGQMFTTLMDGFKQHTINVSQLVEALVQMGAKEITALQEVKAS